MPWRRWRRRDPDLDRELAAHLDLDEADRREAGASPDAARAAARRELGSPTRIREAVYELSVLAAPERWVREWRWAVRSLRRTPWFAVTAVAVMAIALTLFVTVFAIVDGVLFKPLPYASPSQLFLATRHGAPVSDDATRVSGRELARWREALPDVEIAYSGGGASMGLVEGAVAFQVGISRNFLSVLGVRPLLGGFDDADYAWRDQFDPRQHDQRQPVLISYEFWQRVFGGDPDVVGRSVTFAEVRSSLAGIRVAGILPPHFVFPARDGQWAPDLFGPLDLAYRSASAQERPFYQAIVRVGEYLDSESLARRFSDLSGSIGRERVTLHPLSAYVASLERPELLQVALAAGALVLLAIVNVAGLALARAERLGRDVAMRRALGAGGLAIVRPIVAEASMLGLTAAAVTSLAGPLLLAWTSGLLPDSMLLVKPPLVDARVVAAAAFVVAMFVVAVTILVSRMALNGHLLPTLVGTAATASVPSRRGRLLIGFQVACGTVLVVFAGLFGTSLQNALLTSAGFERERLAVIEAFPIVFDGPEQAAAEVRNLQRMLEALPGVAAVAGADVDLAPDVDVDPSTAYAPASWDRKRAGVPSFEVDHGFFGALGLQLRSGRWPSADEWQGGGPVALVSELAAQRFSPDRSIVGRVLHAPPDGSSSAPLPVTVVGVVSDARFLGLDKAPTGAVYIPEGLLNSMPPFSLFVRTVDPTAALLPALAQRVRDDPRFRLARARTVDGALGAAVRPRLLRAWLFGGFGLAAVVILGAGIFALVANVTTRRVREVGIRIALGATPARIVRAFVAEHAVMVGCGLLAGSVAAAATVPLVRSFLYNVGPYDWRGWLIALMTIVLATGLGLLVPSIRAARRPPLDALRTD